MVAQKDRVEIESVASALEAMRLAKPLEPSHPFRQFISLTRPHRLVSPVEGSVGLDSRIYSSLVHLICRHLNVQRAIHRLPPTERLQDKFAALRHDFQPRNIELEAWSVLYYRYVRVDLALSFGQIGEIVEHPERTLNRRQQRGMARLAYELASREARARRKQRQTLLRVKLARPCPPYLIGRDSELKIALAYLAAPDHARHLILHGEAGIGKTTLALALAHQLIEKDVIQSLVWIDNPQPSFERLREAIMQQIGLLQQESALALPLYLQNVETLIVLDQAQALLDESALLSRLTAVLGAARIIVCAAQLPEEVFDMACLLVPPLDKAAAISLLERLAHVRNLGNPEWLIDRYDALFRECGGNPRALRNALFSGRGARLVRAGSV
jgi:hypothetical protein